MLGASLLYKESHRAVLPAHTLHDLRGATAVVTGGTSGIGREVAKRLAGLGAIVLLGSRDAARGEAVRREIEAAGGSAEVIPLDLADLRSARAFGRAVRERSSSSSSSSSGRGGTGGGSGVQLVVAAAAEITCNEVGAPGQLTAEGAVDRMFATNHLGLQAVLAELEPALLLAATAAAAAAAAAGEAREAGEAGEADRCKLKPRVVLVGSGPADGDA